MSSEVLKIWRIKNQFWMPVIFGSSGGPAIKTGMILSWKSLHGLRNTSRNHYVNTMYCAIQKCRLKLCHANLSVALL